MEEVAVRGQCIGILSVVVMTTAMQWCKQNLAIDVVGTHCWTTEARGGSCQRRSGHFVAPYHPGCCTPCLLTTVNMESTFHSWRGYLGRGWVSEGTTYVEGLPRGVYGGGGEGGGWGEGGGMGLHRWRGTCSGGDFVWDDIITALLLGTIGKSQLPAVGNKGISIMELES